MPVRVYRKQICSEKRTPLPFATRSIVEDRNFFFLRVFSIFLLDIYPRIFLTTLRGYFFFLSRLFDEGENREVNVSTTVNWIKEMGYFGEASLRITGEETNGAITLSTD